MTLTPSQLQSWLSPTASRVDYRQREVVATTGTKKVLEVATTEHQFVLERISKTTLRVVAVEPKGQAPTGRKTSTKGRDTSKLTVEQLLTKYNI